MPHQSLSRAAGLELEAYRSRHVEERIERALRLEGLEREEELAAVVAADPDARERFRRSLAVSVSGMFRDPEQFELLEHELLPGLISARGRRLRVWSAGCADGSELRSLAEVLGRLGALEGSYLLGSDLLEGNVAAARAAATDAALHFELRDLLRQPPPGSGWDLILCRNLAIYLAPESRDGLQRMLADALAPGGLLLLGKAERVLAPAALGLERAGPHAYRRRG